MLELRDERRRDPVVRRKLCRFVSGATRSAAARPIVTAFVTLNEER
jgi:hypothetical protein